MHDSDAPIPTRWMRTPPTPKATAPQRRARAALPATSWQRLMRAIASYRQAPTARRRSATGDPYAERAFDAVAAGAAAQAPSALLSRLRTVPS